MKRLVLKQKIADARLYGILDMGYVEEGSIMKTAEALLQGGVDVLQFRAKSYDQAAVLALLEGEAKGLQSLCYDFGVPFVVNDFPHIAAELKADGLHIGQDDGSLAAARDVVGADMLIGRSTHSLEQAVMAKEEGFDYIGFGPLFPTPTKKGRPGIGLENVSKMQQQVGSVIPAFCIGGVIPDNLELVLASGAHRVVIVSALLKADNISQATEAVKAVIQGDLST